MGQVQPGNMRETAGTVDGCLFDMAGQLCGKPIRARGYCMRHYKVMNRAGAFKGRPSLQPGATIPQSAIDRNLSHIDRARAVLEGHAETLANYLVQAAEIAAKKGNHQPALDVLLHARSLEPVISGKAGGTGGQVPAGVRVIVGVQLGTGQVPVPSTQVPVPSHQFAGRQSPQLAATSQPPNASNPDPVVTVDAELLEPA